MTNEELKKKIVEILEKGYTPVEYDDGDWGQTYFPTNEDVADALIEAGIGDVSELKNHRLIAEYSLIPEDDNTYALPNTPIRVKQLYSGEEVEQIVKERKEYKHRAEVAERALYNACCEQNKHWCVQCDSFAECDTSNEMCIKAKKYAEELIKQAEKELAEGKKDKGEVKE